MKVKNSAGPGEEYLNKFKPLQVEVRGNSREDFESALKIFRQMVNREKVISNYKERRYYEKPSDKRRRKRREAEEKRYSMAMKQKLINSGEWEKRQQKRAKRKQSKED